MIPKECKRLAEVDFPIAEVSKHSAREKSIRHGHPSTLHLWWARRPLAACRAILLGLLLPDPCDLYCPEDFKDKARELLPKVQGNIGPQNEDLRQALLKFIGDFSNWDLSTDRTYLEVSRGLVKAAHPEEPPLVVDPFAGGGSIPLEALRLGCEAFASDLNPVACLILKVMLEDIPRHGPELADELSRVGKEIKEAAERELEEFYPDDPDGSKPIAYIWARTVVCEAPNCGAEIPLLRSFWLCKKENRKIALRYKVVRPEDSPPKVEFEIYEPKDEGDVPAGTVTRAKAKCLCCGKGNTVLPPERVRAQLAAQRGGADVTFDEKDTRISGARLLAVVSLKPGEQGRHYRLASQSDYEAVWKAQKQLKAILDEWKRGGKKGLCPVPDEPLPLERMKGSSGFRVLLYGMKTFSDVFTARQKLILLDLLKLFAGQDTKLSPLQLSKIIRHCNTVSFWHKGSETVAGAFGRQALPMCWDYPEYNPLSPFAGGLQDSLDDFAEAAKHINSSSINLGQVHNADATENPLPDRSAGIWFTDPPYYDAIAYADLSDFFMVWLKRVIRDQSLLCDRFDPSNSLSPKEREGIQDPGRLSSGVPKNQVFYESVMAKSFAEGKRILNNDGIGCIVFAHKTTEGWEALLTGIINGGLTVTSSWPIATERGARLLARETAALATSVHLVCRPRPEDASVGDWADVLRELPSRVGNWMERLQGEGIRGADLVFACIGPALEIYSRYSKVVDAEEREIPLGGDPENLEPHKRGFLSYVWEVVGRTALEQVLGTADLPTPRLRQAGAQERNSTAGLPPGALAQGGALEEDARLTALFLWTLQSTNGNGAKVAKEESEDDEETDEEEESPKKKKQGYSLIFDVVRRFAQPLGIHLPEWEGRIIETEKGVVRLLSVKDRAKQLFGEENVQTFAEQFERAPAGSLQLKLFPEGDKDSTLKIKGHKGRKKSTKIISDEGLKSRQDLPAEASAQAGATTLDRIHAAMLLQASGKTNALRAFLKTEQDRGPDFLRLANALSALYPKDSEEKRLLDAMLLAMPR